MNQYPEYRDTYYRTFICALFVVVTYPIVYIGGSIVLYLNTEYFKDILTCLVYEAAIVMTIFIVFVICYVLVNIYYYFFPIRNLNQYNPNGYGGYDESYGNRGYYEGRSYDYDSFNGLPQAKEPLLENDDELVLNSQRFEREGSYMGHVDEHIELADNRTHPVSYDADLIRDNNLLGNLDKI
jgi:uncharacterized membrane protein